MNLQIGDLVVPSSIGWKPTLGIVSDIDSNGMLSIIWPDGWISHAHDTREFIRLDEEAAERNDLAAGRG